MGRGQGRGQRYDQNQAAAERAALEGNFDEVWIEAPELGVLCTQRGIEQEPIHRWMSYRQGFAPALVRRFLDDPRLPAGPILDPFLGSGTTTTEASLRGRESAGVDVVQSLVDIARAPHEGPLPAWPTLPDATNFAEAFAAAEHPLHRAAVLCGAGATVDGEGHRRKALPDRELDLVDRVLEAMREDLAAHPLQAESTIVQGDARKLPFADASFAGVLTSPPYLSRYDYSRVNAPMERLLGRGKKGGRKRQLHAGPHGEGKHDQALHPAGEEAAQRLIEAGRLTEAQTVRGHLNDLHAVLQELARVTMPEALVVIVLAGAEVKKVYVPSDFIVAAMAQELGFEVVELVVARTMRPTGRALGPLRRVSPRETLITLRRRSG